MSDRSRNSLCRVSHINPFPTLVTSEVTSHFGVRGRTDGPCGPRTPVRSKGYGFYLEAPRSHLGSLDDPRALAVAVRVV
jgi:hypothetical protein